MRKRHRKPPEEPNHAHRHLTNDARLRTEATQLLASAEETPVTSTPARTLST